MAQNEPQMPEFDIIKTLSTFLPFIILWGWGKLALDVTDPVVLWSVRGFYLIMMAINFGVIFALEAKIKAGSTKPENAKIIKYVVKRPQTEVYAERSETNPEPEEFQYKEQAVFEYDLEQTAQLKAIMPLVITAVIHLYFGAVQPLVIQAFSTPLRLLENNVVKIHYMGKQMDRPFEAGASPFAGLLGQKSEKEQCDEWDQKQQQKKIKNKKQE